MLRMSASENDALYKFNISTKRSEQIQIATILLKRWNVRKIENLLQDYCSLFLSSSHFDHNTLTTKFSA
jgi:hypothetical protein